jgi:hypothetical protein
MAKTQRLLGHASIATTAEIYTHIGVEDLRGAVDSLSERVNGKQEPHGVDQRAHGRIEQEPRNLARSNQEPHKQAREAQ